MESTMHQVEILAGPFKNDESDENVKRERRVRRPRVINHQANYREITDYFHRRLERLRIVKTTPTPRGQLIDWIPIESQHPRGLIASPPPGPTSLIERGADTERMEILARAELEYSGLERGPEGTVPILRKKLDALGYTKSLKKYLSKTRGHRIARLGRTGFPAPEEDGAHRYGSSGQSITCFGGEGQLSCFDPYTESSDDFSLLQIGLSNSDLGFLQTVEAGWQECQDITGDWVPHLFVYYTTNGYSDDGDNKGGYNTDVDGWVQYDNTIFPGTTFTPYSTRGGDQFKITIKYQLWQDNWWFACQGRWIGYYPARLFMGNQSVFSTLGDHADHIGFWGEVFDSDDVSGRTSTDMGSGYFGESGWPWSGYMHNLMVQTRRDGGMANYDGSAEVSSPDPDMYDIDAHFNSGSSWGSYAFVGGPGAG
jgi:Neprosin